MIKKILNAKDWGKTINLALFVLRVAIAFLMLHHGTPKLMKLIGGDLKFSDPIGLGSETSFILTVFAEFFCSILLLIGLGTRLASIPLIITMVVIIFIVHGNESMFAHYNVLLYLLGYILLLITGSGKYSLDYYLQRRN